MFDQIVGHERQKGILSREIAEENVSHAYLFSGEEGIGKRMTAKAFAAELIKARALKPDEAFTRVMEERHADFIVLEAQGKTIGIEPVRQVAKQVNVRPLEGGRRVVLIDDAEKMTPEAQNALLKTLEEPPENNIFILVTSRTDLLLPTIMSRCEKLFFLPLSALETQTVVEGLGIDVTDARTPLEAVRRAENPEAEEKFREAGHLFERVMKGDMLSALLLAEKISESKEVAQEICVRLIERLRRKLTQDDILTPSYFEPIRLLFELIERIQYNINLRLQVEACMIKIAKIRS